MVGTPVGTVVEDYVKVIYAHTEWQPKPITSSELAARLGLAPSTVTEMVKKLQAAGLVTHRPYGAIELTMDGSALALRMVRRHRLIETWLVDACGYGWHEVHDEAEVLEHAVSDRLLEVIAAQLGDPTTDPHGDPIPAADGSITRPAADLLRDVAVGATGTVVRISDRDSALLQRLGEQSVVVGSEVTVVGAAATDGVPGAVTVRVGGVERVLDAGAAASIWITH
ncbi:metal-dependent transcriptional regulator [Marisediminicola senii]|uniref:metal-dependent transcriptional regulator n=1 Tax=Marisediminicola senii TaxID=2711233 RepID=UPI0013EB8FA1|nr:metal-dependent transcriptional regulator [Marisediminicola senii]